MPLIEDNPAYFRLRPLQVKNEAGAVLLQLASAGWPSDAENTQPADAAAVPRPPDTEPGDMGPEPPPVPATGATAGTPGTWTPPGYTSVPSDASGAGSIVASPTTAWTTGQYMQGATAGAAGEMYWNGTAWVSGKAT